RASARAWASASPASQDLIEELKKLPWPGNVRELENTLIRAAVMAPGEVLLKEHFPFPKAPPPPPPMVREAPRLLSLAEAERQAILKALEASRWHKGRACQILGISRPTL